MRISMTKTTSRQATMMIMPGTRPIPAKEIEM